MNRQQLEYLLGVLHQRTLPDTDPQAAPGEPSRPTPELPEQVGRFPIRRLLGEGGFGVVYLAHDPRLGREVALKVLRPAFSSDPTQRRRFLREGEAAARLRHPHIVAVHEAGEADHQAYLVSDYYPGSTLARWLRECHPPPPPHTIAHLVRQLAEAIHHAHAHHIIHRDLKPANVLLAEDGSPRITDFGLAKEEDDDGLTRSGDLIGTPAYMAPEQASGKEAGPTTDVYSLGVILYEGLTGQVPFRGATKLDTLRQVAEDDPPLPRRLRADLPRDLEAICLKCLEKDPRRRYPSAGALAEDLARFLKGHTTIARPLTPIGRSLRWVRRHPLPVAFAGLILAALLAGIAGALYHSHQMQQALDDLQEREARLSESQQQLKVRLDIANLRQAVDALAGHSRQKVLDRLHAIDPNPGPEGLRGFVWDYLHRQVSMQTHTLTGHQRDVYHVAFSPDGKTLASTGADGTIRLWEVRSGRLLRSWQAHRGEGNHLAFDAAGKRLASSSDHEEVKVWDLRSSATPPPHQRLAVPGVKVFEIAWVPGAEAIVGMGDDHTFRVWDLRTGTVRETYPYSGPIRSLCLHPTPSRSLAFLTDGDRDLYRIDLGEQQVRHLNHHDAGWVRVVACNSGGDRLAAQGKLPDRIRVLDSQTGSVIHAFPSASKFVRTIAFDPRDERIAWGFDGGFFQVGDLTTRTNLGLWNAHDRRIWSLRFSPDGQWLATASADGTVKLWETEVLGNEYVPARLDEGRILDLAVLTTPPLLVAAINEGSNRLALKTWDYQRRETVAERRLPDDLGNATCVLSPDQRSVYVVRSEGQVHCFRLPNLEPIQDAFPTGDTLPGLDCATSGSLLAVRGEDKVEVWETRSWQRLAAFESPSSRAKTLAFSPDTTTLVWLDREGTLARWSVADRRRLPSLAIGKAGVAALTFSPDGKRLAVGMSDHVVQLVDAHTGRKRFLVGHTRPISDLAFSPDSKVLVSSTVEEVRFWHVATGQELYGFTQNARGGSHLAFHPRGHLLFHAHNTPDGCGVRLYRGGRKGR